MAALTAAEIGAIVDQQISLAKSHDNAERATASDKALDYYFGRMDSYVPPEANRSKVVSHDVADTINTTLPQVVRVFLSTDNMAIVEPVSDQDEEFARQATQGLNYVFLRDNDGDGIVYDGTWDSLMHGNSVVKTFYDDTPVYATSFHSGLTDDGMAQLLQPDERDNEPEVLAHSEVPGTLVDPATGQQMPVTLHDVKIKRVKADGSFVVTVIPPEEFLIDGDAVTTEEAAFTDHWQRKTRSDLVKMGYAKEDVWAIPVASRVETAAAASRNIAANTSEAADKSMELVDYHEAYIRMDVDGDGEAELVRVCQGGGSKTPLHWEVWEDDNPFSDIKCKPIPHRWLAGSQTDDVVEVQDVKTVLRRQFLNNIYWATNPQRAVKGKVLNPEQFDNPTFGGTVFLGADGEIIPLEVPQIGEIALAGIAHMDETLQRRTGIIAQGEAIDPDELQHQTAAAVHDKKDARYTQVEQYARNMARGWSAVFRKLLKLMVKHQDYSRQVMFNGKPVVIDPRSWNEDMHVTINVGLGTGSRDRDLQMLQSVLQSQLLLADRFMTSGDLDDAIDMLPKILTTMTRMAECAGIKNPDDYYPEFTQDKVAALKQMAAQKAQQPDPLQVKAQADQAAKDQQAQRDHDYRMAQAQSDLQLNQQKADAANGQELTRINGHLANERYQIDQELALKVQQINAELALRQSVPPIQPGGQPG